MKHLYHCKACGFIGSKGTDFVQKNGVIFCAFCIDDFYANREPETTWVKAYLDAQKEKVVSKVS